MDALHDESSVRRAKKAVVQFFDALKNRTHHANEDWPSDVRGARAALSEFFIDLEKRIQYTTVDWPKTAAEYLAKLRHLPAPELWKEYGIDTIFAALHLMEGKNLNEAKIRYATMAKPLPEWTWLVALRFGRAFTSFTMSDTTDRAWDGKLFEIPIVRPGPQTQYGVLVLAASSGDVDLLRTLDAVTGHQVLSKPPEDSDLFAVEEAAANGHVAVLEYLWQQKAFPKEYDERYALCAAAENGHKEAVRYLLELESDDREPLISSEGVQEASDAAAERYQLEVLRTLLDHEELNPLSFLHLVYGGQTENSTANPKFKTTIENTTRLDLLRLIVDELVDNPGHNRTKLKDARTYRSICYLGEEFLMEADRILAVLVDR